MVTQHNSIWDKKLVWSFSPKVNLAAVRVKSHFLHRIERGCSRCIASNSVYGALLQGGDALNPREFTYELCSIEMRLSASSCQQTPSLGLRNWFDLKMSQLSKV